MNDQERLRQIRQRHADAPHGWEAVWSDAVCTLNAYPPCPMTRTSIREPYATLDGNEPEAALFLSRAHDDVGFLLGLIKRAVIKINELQGNVDQIPARNTAADPTHSERPGRLARHAAMMVTGDEGPAFKRFLKDFHNLGHATDTATTTKIRELCAIASRKQLDTDPAKGELYWNLICDFQQWKKQRSHAKNAEKRG